MRFLILASIVISILSSCQSKITGCMDPKASNYDPFAERYGECTYAPDVPVVPGDTTKPKNYGSVKFVFNAEANGKPFSLNENFKDNKNRNFLFSIFKFYVSNVKFVVGSNKVLVKDVALLDYDTSTPASPGIPRFYSYFESDSVEVGEFSDIYLGFGVDPELNEEYRNTSYPTEHPLNTTYNKMGWGWAGKYIFTMVEGRLDTDSNTIYDESIFWHTGLSELYRFAVIPANGVKVLKGQTTTVNLKLDVVKLFEGLDIGTFEGKTHTEEGAPKVVASTFQTNLSRAVSLQGITYE
ncbi:MAG: hypothetical protein KDC83_11015 [Flavobacteriales bacterium]|nr:hypothetical protein [Flavobacteriales bacterium]